MGNEMLSALANASTMLVMLRRADRVKIGCATGGINMLCQTDREHVWKGAAYYPFIDMIRLAKGVSLRCEGTCDTYDVPGYAIDDMNQYGGFTGVKTIQAAAALRQSYNAMRQPYNTASFFISTCPCGFGLPFCNPSLARQCLTLSLFPALAVQRRALSAKRNGGGFFVMAEVDDYWENRKGTRQRIRANPQGQATT